MGSEIPDSSFLYSGGLAETVSCPSDLTYSFLAYWFCGARSLGKGMELLGLPYKKIDLPLVVLKDGVLFVNLLVEEQTLYSQTIFHYRAQKDSHMLPSLEITYARLFSYTCLTNTFKIVLYQSNLISHPDRSVEKAKQFIAAMPQDTQGKSFEEIDTILTDHVWPSVIAIGALCEFYSRLIEQEAGSVERFQEILSYVSARVSPNDWFFTSLSHQSKVRDGKMSFDDYLSHYGIRAAKDYELAYPRWHEEQHALREQIQSGDFVMPERDVKELPVTKKLTSYINATIKLQILRSEARRIALLWVDALRQSIIQKVGEDIAHYTRDELLAGVDTKEKENRVVETVTAASSPVTHGEGMPVSPGEIQGKIQHILSPLDTIPSGTIGVFPNASTDFTMLYPRCAGVIFLAGGQTSHGAIVAREFGIPAIVESGAKDVLEGATIALNGRDGTWKVV